MKLCDLMRLQHTQRWTIVPTTRPQSVAEHSFNVTMIAIRIAELSSLSFNQSALMKAALNHDMAEAITGDMPTPTKSKMRDLGFDPDELDVLAIGRVASLPCDCAYVVKAADLLDAIYFLTNFGTGKRATAVLRRLVIAFDTLIVNVREAMPVGFSDEAACKMAAALHAVREEVLSEDWTE